MDLTFSPVEEAFRAELRGWLAANVPPEWRGGEPPEFASLDESVSIKPAELKMAAMLVDSFADDFHPEDYTDEYREELQQLIEAKLEGGEAFKTPEGAAEGEDAEVVDLLAALQRSVERQKKTG